MSMTTLVLAWGRYGLTPTILSIKSESTKSTKMSPEHLARAHVAVDVINENPLSQPTLSLLPPSTKRLFPPPTTQTYPPQSTRAPAWAVRTGPYLPEYCRAKSYPWSPFLRGGPVQDPVLTWAERRWRRGSVRALETHTDIVCE